MIIKGEEIDPTGYIDLASEIVRSVCNDYLNCCKHIKKYRMNSELKRKEELKDWFFSDYGGALLIGVDPEDLVSMLESMADRGDYQLGKGAVNRSYTYNAKGNVLREFRQERGDSLKAVAAYLEMSPAHLSSIERGFRNPHKSTYEKLEVYYGKKTVNKFIKEIEEANNEVD